MVPCRYMNRCFVTLNWIFGKRSKRNSNQNTLLVFEEKEDIVVEMSVILSRSQSVRQLPGRIDLNLLPLISCSPSIISLSVAREVENRTYLTFCLKPSKIQTNKLDLGFRFRNIQIDHRLYFYCSINTFVYIIEDLYIGWANNFEQPNEMLFHTHVCICMCMCAKISGNI